jgi:sugar lactone lactonase YvrE
VDEEDTASTAGSCHLKEELTMKADSLLLLLIVACFSIFISCEGPENPSFGPNHPDPNPTGKVPATITAVDPPQGFLRDVVTIRGSGFDPTPAFNLVAFGNKTGTVLTATATQLTVEAPNVTDETVKVRVAVKGSELWSNELDFTFLPTLRIISEEISWPNGIAVDDAENVYVGSANDGVILKFAPDGTSSEFAAVPVKGAMEFGPQGFLYVCEKDEGKVVRISSDGSTIEDVAAVENATDFDWDANGNLYIVSADYGIFRLTPGGELTEMVGDIGAVKNCRVFGDHLYVNKIWDSVISRFPITASGLGEEEIYLDLGGTDTDAPSSFDFDEQGTMYWAHAWVGNLYAYHQDGTQETLYEGQLKDAADSPLRYLTFYKKTVYCVFPGWADIGTAMSAYIGVMQAPNYGRQ